MADQSKDIDAGERDKRRNAQEQGTKEAKLNRALEELEKYKLALKEAKLNDGAKNEGIRKDLDKLTDENRRLEK